MYNVHMYMYIVYMWVCTRKNVYTNDPEKKQSNVRCIFVSEFVRIFLKTILSVLHGKILSTKKLILTFEKVQNNNFYTKMYVNKMYINKMYICKCIECSI